MKKLLILVLILLVVPSIFAIEMRKESFNGFLWGANFKDIASSLPRKHYGGSIVESHPNVSFAYKGPGFTKFVSYVFKNSKFAAYMFTVEYPAYTDPSRKVKDQHIWWVKKFNLKLIKKLKVNKTVKQKEVKGNRYLYENKKYKTVVEIQELSIKDLIYPTRSKLVFVSEVKPKK